MSLVNGVVVTERERATWAQTQGAPGYRNEHTKLMKSIRGEGPHVNEAMTVAERAMTCIMGREAAYSGEMITWDTIMASKQDLFPKGGHSYGMKWAATRFPVPGEYKFG